MTPPRILALWSLPRSRSTAFYRMMVERRDFQVLHEPFSNLAEFGEKQLDGTNYRTEAELLAGIRAAARRRPLFFKDTTDESYPGVLADTEFLGHDVRHTFLIRHPRATIASYHALNPEVKRHQIGVESMYRLFSRVRELTGTAPLVIDADDLVAAPSVMVSAYCAAVSIPFLPAALRWKPAAHPSWRQTAAWHEHVSASEGFSSAPTGPGIDVERHPVLADHLRHHLPFYAELRHHRIRV